MKNITLFATLLLFGCTQSKTEEIKINEYEKLDSVISKSQKNQTIASGAVTKSDSVVSGKVEQTINKITHLETQVQQLKAENNELKDKLNDATDVGKPYSGLPVSGN